MSLRDGNQEAVSVVPTFDFFARREDFSREGEAPAEPRSRYTHRLSGSAGASPSRWVAGKARAGFSMQKSTFSPERETSRGIFSSEKIHNPRFGDFSDAGSLSLWDIR